MPIRLVGGPEEAAAQLIAHLQCKRTLDNKGNVVPEELSCRKHAHGPIDVWYDCPACLKEPNQWADKCGFDYCVSPSIERRGTDCGYWVLRNQGRWGEKPQ